MDDRQLWFGTSSEKACCAESAANNGRSGSLWFTERLAFLSTFSLDNRQQPRAQGFELPPHHTRLHQKSYGTYQSVAVNHSIHRCAPTTYRLKRKDSVQQQLLLLLLLLLLLPLLGSINPVKASKIEGQRQTRV